MPDPSAPQSAMQGKSGERPERQLNDVVVELRGCVIEIVQAIDNQHRCQRSRRADDGPGH